MVWAERRRVKEGEQVKEGGHEGAIQSLTGLIIDPYFSATKIQWILDHIPGIRSQAVDGRILCGTVETWLIWKMTGGKLHITEPSNASRTMLFNLSTSEWDPGLLKLFDIPGCMMPEVRLSSEVYGEISSVPGLSSMLLSGAAGG